MQLSKSEIKIIQSLKTAHGRKKHEAFLVEGPKLVEELITTSLEIKYLLATQDWSDSHTGFFSKTNTIKQSELDRFSLFSNANQVIAVVGYPNEKDFKLDTDKYILVLDTIQDPGNLGTMIRTADWFGIHQLICSKETADLFNPKVVQSSMGSVFRVNVQYKDLLDLIKQYPKTPVYGTLLEGTEIHKLKFSGKGFIIIGNESKGMSENLKKLINQAVYIPRASNSMTESLNAAVACGILLSHLKNS